MENMQQCPYPSTTGPVAGNSGHNEPVNIPTVSPQLTGPVFFTFPPPPCIPSPANTPSFSTSVVLQQPISNTPEGDEVDCNSGNHQDEKIAELSENFSNNMNLNSNMPQQVNVEYTGPYSVILPPGSFVHHVSSSGSAPVYHQFSPVIRAGLPHPVYPVNFVPPKDPTCPTLVPVRPAPTQDNYPPSSVSVPPSLPQVPESPWSGQLSTMTTNPPLYWGPYMAPDKGHAVTFAPQTFMRRHSIIENPSVVTPTNVCPPCNIAGIVSATPEFIHPRKPDVPQWLMSPPVGDQDPSIISYAPMLYPNHAILMSPDDFTDGYTETIKLLTPNDFSSEGQDTNEQLLSPHDFDSGYDSEKCSSAGSPSYPGAMKLLLQPSRKLDDCEGHQDQNKAKNFPLELDWQSRSVSKKVLRLDESSFKTFPKAKILHNKNFTEAVIKAESSTQTATLRSCSKHRKNMSLLYSYLLNAAVHLSAASHLFLCRKKNSTHCVHKKLLSLHGFLPQRCSCTRKHSLSSTQLHAEQQFQCWQCAADTPDGKQPGPDVFNQWPNIPPPPAPLAEEDDCQSVCSASHICPDALPIAAALFHNEPTNCCTGSSQDDDLQMPPDYPIGVFWDIENCAVPTGKSAQSIVQRVREKFFAGHKEAEFMCVCDINKESKSVVQELNNAQVNVVHINATAKNAADDKLRQSIRRFAHSHPAPATLVLITGDSNFTSEVSDLRHRHKYFVVLIHPSHASQALKQAATTVICYEQLVADLPIVHFSPKGLVDLPQALLLVSNLPLKNDANAVRARLRQLSENCGGKVIKLSMGTAILKFATTEAANRALKRIEGEDVFGHSIKVSILRQSPDRINRNGKNFSNSPNYSPGRNSETSNHTQMGPDMVNGNMQPSNQNISMTPGHPVPPAIMPTFQQFPFPNVPPAMMLPPPGPFTIPPNMPPRMPTFHPVNVSPNIIHNGYNSMSQLPQPQLFQPPLRHPKDRWDYGIKLTVSNIDAQLGVSSIKEILLKQISGYCQVLEMKVRPHNRFTVVCDVTVPHLQDASQVLQNLQRKKIGTKRVLVTLAQQGWDEFGYDDATCLKRECFSILKDYSGRKMPLYRFFSLYEKRFQHKVKLDELRQIPDVVLLSDGPAGREIYINSKIKDEQSFEQHIMSYPRSGRSTPDISHDFLLPVCKMHHPSDAQRPPTHENSGGLLKIEMGLREFSAKLHALLHSHNGILQLDGFEYCYCAEYGTFPFPNDMEEGGVIVEHQASYVPGVQIITSQPHCLGVKAIVWAQPQSDTGSDTASDTSGASRWKSPNLINFSREVVDLLKKRPYCCLAYDNFGSAYQVHFGHVCRPSDYGFTRLTDLLLAIPHVLQIMGSLSNRILTLTHRAQVKRFTQEVVKILKSTPDRAILVAQMPELYNRTFNRIWKLRDYGVSVLSDLLDDIPEGHICTTGEGDNIVLSLPIRERTAEEKERTNQFAREVVKILRSRPHYRMPFTDFVPAYHRHFGRQCKLANYGFSKLIDLFEALPHVVQVLEKGTEKHLALTELEQQKILSIQITSILRAQIPPPVPFLSGQSESTRKIDVEGPSLPLACIPALFQQKYGFPLLPRELNTATLDELIGKLSHAVKVAVNKSGDKMIKLAERKPIRLLSAQLLALLLDQSADQLDVEQLHNMYMERYKETIEPHDYGFVSFCDIIKKALPGVVKMDLDAPECLIHIKPLYKEARSIRSVLLKNNGTMTIGEFNFAYLTTFHRPMDCEKLGFPTYESLLRALPNVLIVKGFGAKRTLTLRNHMQYGPLTAMTINDGKSDQSITASSSLDDVQSLEMSCPPQTLWVPKVPPCMMPFWTNRQSVANSASAGNFRPGTDKRTEKMLAGIGKPAPKFISPNLTTSHPVRHTQQLSRNSQPDMQSKLENKEYSTKSRSTKCTFTIGQVPVMNSSCLNKENNTPRRGVSISVITLPNGSTPIASTSSCSTTSSPKSDRSSDSIDDDSDDSRSSIEKQNTPVINSYSSYKTGGVSSLPSSPFSRITATAYVGPLSSLSSRHPASDHGSPSRIQLAASFSTITQS